MVGAAVKVTELPAQIIVADADIITETGKLGFTIILTGVELAGEPVAQVAFEVSWQVTRSPLVGL